MLIVVVVVVIVNEIPKTADEEIDLFSRLGFRGLGKKKIRNS